MSTSELPVNAVTHGGILPLQHPALGVEVDGETAIRYLRFGRKVRLERLELPRSVYGRRAPSVPTHPAHIILSVLDQATARWQAVREIELPYDPRTSGEGLSQAMSNEEMEAHFAQILADPPYVIELNGLETDHLRVECDREHPVWPSHGEINGGPYHVPFGILHPLRAFGDPREVAVWSPAYQPILSQRSIQPAAPKGMQVQIFPHLLLFSGERFSVGFSLRRPILLHVGWDAFASGQAARNRHLLRARAGNAAPGALSGSVLRTLQGDYLPQHWTGQVFAQDNRVTYHGLHFNDDLRYDITFTVEAECLHVDIMQFCYAELPVLETEAWRFSWDLTAGMTAAAAEPIGLPEQVGMPGRNGGVRFPVWWATDGCGCLSMRQMRGKAAYLQVASYPEQNCTTGGAVMAAHAAGESCLVLPAGVRTASFELALTELAPCRAADAPPLSDGLRRHWGSVFACYRAESRGFSQNAATANSHPAQLAPIELAVLTAPPEDGPDPLALARFTIARALLDGGGCGYARNLYLDTDPVLVSAAGRLHQVQPDASWLHRVAPGLIAAVQRMIAEIGEEGLLVCRDLSGNSGSARWGCNEMAAISFGHLDAYVNALGYRAFRNATALLATLGEKEMAARCRKAAEGIRAAFARQLVNPDTGWVAGWRSRDGALHDYAFTWVNGAALAFGLLDEKDARRALGNLEELRERLGISTANLGLPLNLLPIREDDHMLSSIPGMPSHTFEADTDGSLCALAATYYLRALSIYGLTDSAHRLAGELDAAYAAGLFSSNSGSAFRAWDGAPTGAEGPLIGNFAPLYAIALEKGQFAPTNPEWWPAGG